MGDGRVKAATTAALDLDELKLVMAEGENSPGGGRSSNLTTCRPVDEDRSSTNSWIDDQLQKGLQEQSLRAWSLIKGCSARRPLCGSKCDQVGDHGRHRCTHHLFPSFHGWMDRQNGFPSFHYCK